MTVSKDDPCDQFALVLHRSVMYDKISDILYIGEFMAIIISEDSLKWQVRE